MKAFNYSKLCDRRFYDAMRPVGKLFFRNKFEYHYFGQKNIPSSGGFILACNHFTALDPVYIGLGAANRQLHFMAKSELYENPFVAFAFTRLNAFPVRRGMLDKEAFEYAVRVAKQGYALAMFPEGTRSKTFEPQRAKHGAARIAYEAKVPVLPVSIYTADEMKPHTKLTIRYGELITFEEMGFGTETPDREKIVEVSDMIMERITNLWRQGHCE